MLIVCPACGHEMTGNPVVCENCNEPMPLPTGDTVILKGETAIIPTKKKRWSSAEVGEGQSIRVLIDQAVRTIRLPTDAHVTLGRADEDSEQKPDIDLTPHNALAGGVSRIHAALRLYDGMVQVKDLNSTNGTVLNGQQVSAHEWRIVRDGDKLRLGSLTMTLFFDTD
jgi:pSer/pThr/pTyr-binding forkhead associated (FHA) protein